MAQCVQLAAALVFAGLFCGALAEPQCDTAGTDETLLAQASGDDVVQETANKIRRSGIFGNDYEYLRRMAAVESNFGETRGPGGGIWRVSSNVYSKADGYLKNKQEAELENAIFDNFCFRWSDIVRYSALNVPLYSALTVMVYLKQAGVVINDSIEQQAEVWTNTFNGAQHEFIARSNALQDAECQIKGVDMVFVMDESGSILSANFELMKQLAIDITQSFEIGPDRTRVAWISFSNTARVVFHLNQYSDKDSLHEAIRSVVYLTGGTRIDIGIETLRTQGFIGGRNTFDIPEVAIVVTDGLSKVGSNTSLAAQSLHDERNVNVFVVGVGNGVDTVELEIVASAGIETTENHIYHINSFGQDELRSLQRTIRARTCFDAMFSDHITSIDELNNAGVRIPQATTVHVAVECPPEGLTINACGRTGLTILYISTTRSPNGALYDKIIRIKSGRCHNTYIPCPARRRRQTDSQSDRIYITIEGVEEENEYDLNAMPGDFSTPQVNLLCNKQVDDDMQSVVVSCTHDRELTETNCSINRSPPIPCTLPLRVDLTPSTREYTIQIAVTDSLNLTDEYSLTHTVGPLVIDCSLNSEMEIVCLSSNLLDNNATICSFAGQTIDPCVLPQKIDVKGLPLGTHKIHLTATDVFGSTAVTSFDYLVVGDRVGDDMVFSVVLDISPVEVGVTEQTVALCYQVHGEDGKFYNLVSDECVSVNAHVTRPFPEINSHVIDEISVRATGTNGSCYDILVSRENCSVSVNRESIPINTYFEEGNVSLHNDRRIARRPNVIRISVPNCGRALVDTISIKCTEYAIRDAPAPTEVLEFTATRGLSPIEAAHGLVGQFWGRFMLGQSQPPLSHPRERYDKAMTIFHETTQKRFSGFVKRAWSHRDMCFYAGDKQGSPVIQGAYTDYEVEGSFDTAYQFSRFDENLCVGQEWNG